MARTLVGILIGVAFVVALVVVTLDQIRVTCEVCIAYKGRQLCEEVSAVDRAEAVMHATASACAQLANGVTDGIQCNNTRPISTQCSE